MSDKYIFLAPKLSNEALISAGIAAAQAAALGAAGAAGGIAIEKTVEAIKSTTKH